jgi:hypothetical protein
MANVADSKLRRITGHKPIKMAEHYTHFNGREFSEVREVQNKLLAEPEAKARLKGKRIKPGNRGKQTKVKKTS